MAELPLRFSAPTKAGNVSSVARRRGWHWRLHRVFRALGRDNISIMAAGIAYYAMLSIFPGMSALVFTYGLVADPLTIARHEDALSGVLPTEALNLLSTQLNALVSTPPGSLGAGLIISVLIAFWSSTSGTSAMMNALTVAYEGKEKRGLLHFYGLSLALTIGGVTFLLLSLGLIAGVPAAAAELPLSPFWRQLLPLLRFPILAVLAYLAIGTLYRLAPDRPKPGWDLLRGGTIIATLLWLAGSAAFSFYASHFGSYDRTYGSVGAVAIMLVWLYVTAYIVLVGAELNGDILRDDADLT
jgi:membrane protein